MKEGSRKRGMKNLDVEIKKSYMIRCLCKGLRSTLGKDRALTGAGLRYLDLKYLGKGMTFYGLIIIGRNFGVRFVHKQRSSMNPWQWSKDTLEMTLCFSMCFS